MDTFEYPMDTFEYPMVTLTLSMAILILTTVVTLRFRVKVNFKHKNASPGKSLNGETIFCYYHDEIDQETNFEISFKKKY